MAAILPHTLKYDLWQVDDGTSTIELPKAMRLKTLRLEIGVRGG